MCGIAGIVTAGAEQRGLTAAAERMCERLRHRGPDAGAVYAHEHAVLGHRRLSIIDVASGHQPMTSPDGRVTLVFNGEIYNHERLRADLARRGHAFRTGSDTEVILAAYLIHGERGIELLRGMFAFAIWDAPERRLLLARDRLGIKPLFFAATRDRLVFASELKGLMSAGGVSSELDVQALDDYLAYGFIRAPRTIFSAARSLLPGELLRGKLGADGALSLERAPFWQLPAPGPEPRRDYDAAREELRALLDESVKIHLMSEVPLGALLSGGVDSSSVVAAMARAQTRRVRTFSIGFSDEDFDESPIARAVARHFDTEHHSEMVTPDALAILPEIAREFDEPFADPSAIPTWYVCRMARREVTVCLTGDGGDELFAGYRRYTTIADERARPPAQGLAARIAAELLPESRARNQAERAALDADAAYARFRNNFSPAMRAALYRPELARRVALDETQNLFQRRRPPDHADPIARAQLADLQGYLTDDILVKVDRTSMAHSLEVRVPLLDHELVEFAQSLPTDFKLRDGRSKAILKDVVFADLPPEASRHPKRGFSVPLGRWFRGELKARLRDAIESPTFQGSELFDGAYARRLYRLHQTRVVDLSFQLWQLVMLEAWWREVRPALTAER